MRRLFWGVLAAVILPVVISIKAAKEVLLDDSLCFYSCSSCVGEHFYECVTCKEGYELTVISTINDISAIGLQGRAVSLLTGTCECSTSNQTNQTNNEQCSEQHSPISQLSEYGIFSVGLGTMIIALCRLIFELHITFLLEFFDLIQFLSNFIFLNQQDILSTYDLHRFYAAFNPVYLMNYSSQKDNANSGSISVEALVMPINNIKNTYKTETISIKNALSQDYYKLSTYMNKGSQQFSTTSKWYFLVILITLLISGFSRFLHKKYLKQKVYPKAAESESEFEKESARRSQVCDSFRGRIAAFRNRQQLTLDYRHSKYFTVYWYLLTLPITVFYLTLNTQLIYLLIQFSNISSTISASIYNSTQTPSSLTISIPYETIDILSILGFLLCFIISSLIIFKLCGQPDSHLVLEKTVIFNGILTQRSCISRYIPIFKILFKTIEVILFVQLYHNIFSQLISLMIVSLVQICLFILLSPFSRPSSNRFLVFSALSKFIIILFRLITLLYSDQHSLFILFSTLFAIQFTLIFFYFIIGLAIFILSGYFYFAAKQQRQMLEMLKIQSFSKSQSPDQPILDLQLSDQLQNITINPSDVSPDKSALIHKQSTSFCITASPCFPEKGFDTTFQGDYNNNITITNNVYTNNDITFDGGAITANNRTSDQFKNKPMNNHNINKFENILDDLDKSTSSNNNPQQRVHQKYSSASSYSNNSNSTDSQTIDNVQVLPPIKEITIVQTLNSNKNFETIPTLQTTSSAAAAISNKASNSQYNNGLGGYSKKRYFETPNKLFHNKKSRVSPFSQEDKAIQEFQELNEFIAEEDINQNQEQVIHPTSQITSPKQ